MEKHVVGNSLKMFDRLGGGKWNGIEHVRCNENSSRAPGSALKDI